MVKVYRSPFLIGTSKTKKRCSEALSQAKISITISWKAREPCLWLWAGCAGLGPGWRAVLSFPAQRLCGAQSHVTTGLALPLSLSLSDLTTQTLSRAAQHPAPLASILFTSEVPPCDSCLEQLYRFSKGLFIYYPWPLLQLVCFIDLLLI